MTVKTAGVPAVFFGLRRAPGSVHPLAPSNGTNQIRDNTCTMTILTRDIPASRLRRFACMMYEGVLLFAVVFLAGYLFDTLTQSRHALALRHGRQAVLFAAIGLYFVLCWRLGGQTLAMKTWHIRLVGSDGAPPGLRQLIARYVLSWLVPLAGAGLIAAAAHGMGWPSMYTLIIVTPFLNFIWTWLDRDAVFLHDRLLGTRLSCVSPTSRAS